MNNIILIGMKSCGKSTVGNLLAKRFAVPFIELDSEIQRIHDRKYHEHLSCRELFVKYGEFCFRTLETESLMSIVRSPKRKPFVLSCGGGTPMYSVNQQLLRDLGLIIFLDTDQDVILARINRDGIPGFFPVKNDPKKSLQLLSRSRNPVYRSLANVTIPIRDELPTVILSQIVERIQI
jgi:shikimate kinase